MRKEEREVLGGEGREEGEIRDEREEEKWGGWRTR